MHDKWAFDQYNSIETVCISLNSVIHILLNHGEEGVKQHDYMNTGGMAKKELLNICIAPHGEKWVSVE